MAAAAAGGESGWQRTTGMQTRLFFFPSRTHQDVCSPGSGFKRGGMITRPMQVWFLGSTGRVRPINGTSAKSSRLLLHSATSSLRELPGSLEGGDG